MFDPLRPQNQRLVLPHCVIDSDYYRRPWYRHFKNMQHYWLCGRLDATLAQFHRAPRNGRPTTF
jgi:hypothetical protein